MIEYQYQSGLQPLPEQKYTDWLSTVVAQEGKHLGELCYVFLDDEALLQINRQFLQHDYYTDIITFDYSENQQVSGDLCISVERVTENAKELGIDFQEELRRVMVHGLLHLIGYGDKSTEEQALMRQKEDEKLAMFHVEQKEDRDV